MTTARRPAARRAVPPRERALDDTLFFKLVRLVNLTARPFAEHIGRANRLTLTEWRAMIVLASHPGIAAQEVVARTGLDKMSVSRAIASLERHARVSRREDPNDKRRAHLTLTAAGRRVFERIAESATAREAQLFANVSTAEQRQMNDTLDKLLAGLASEDSKTE